MYNSKYVKGDYDMVNWENNIRRVVPYTPGEQPDQPDMIKLNTNENPYPPAPGVTKSLRSMDTDALTTLSGSCCIRIWYMRLLTELRALG